MDGIELITTVGRFLYKRNNYNCKKLERPGSILVKFEVDSGICVFVDKSGMCDVWLPGGDRLEFQDELSTLEYVIGED